MSISLKLINGGPNKVWELEKIEKLISGGRDVYLAPESSIDFWQAKNRTLKFERCDFRKLS